MPPLNRELPTTFYIAVSGGIDSMVVLDFFNKKSRRDSILGVLHVNHNTGEYADKCTMLVSRYCRENDIWWDTRRIKEQPPKGQSKEEWWRDRRYEFFHSFDAPVILAHHLDDCLEEYLTCVTIKGYMGTIPYSNKNCIRPFRLWKKNDIISYARKHQVQYLEDPSNTDCHYRRNYFRHVVIPPVLKINPGIYNIVERLITEESNVKEAI